MSDLTNLVGWSALHEIAQNSEITFVREIRIMLIGLNKTKIFPPSLSPHFKENLRIIDNLVSEAVNKQREEEGNLSGKIK